MSADITGDYVESGFNQRLGFGARPALVVVDFVKAYLMPGNPLYAGVEPALAAAVTLVDAARSAGIPVIYTVVHYERGTEGGPFFRKVAALQNFVGDTEAGEICDELAPRPGDPVIRKRFASAFFDTDLKQRLDDLGADSVLVSGLSTSGCVRATALDAVQSGLIPIVVREAVGDRAAGPHDAALFDLDAKYADVVGLDEVLTYLRDLPSRR
ncbi:isochorismatase family protein [Spirillospora sp. NPDC047279]|uniref:isochorismatase family protein n=1 Tax=Spirillospora sp. NPDC047279 TaxID=3155478 RepID=UPI0033D53C96